MPIEKKGDLFHEDESKDKGSKCVTYELSSVKESLDTIAAEAEEDRQDNFCML
jgi:hypothetical protein